MNASAAPFPGRFEGSYLGDASRIAPTTRMECKICWHVYDPAEGCEHWQIPAGTPFAALPDHWRCPVCDGDHTQFMVLDIPDPGGDVAPPAAPAAPVAAPAQPTQPTGAIRQLEAVFREIHTAQMRGLPIVNDALAVKAVGFRPWEGRWLGALVTPWFMNLVLLPGDEDDWSGLTPGAKELIEFPSGRYEFLHAKRPGIGAYKACSLFSPMFEFGSLPQATETALAALAAIFDPANREDGTRQGDIRRKRESDVAAAAEAEAPTSTPTPTADATGDRAPSRRALLLGTSSTRAAADA